MVTHIGNMIEVTYFLIILHILPLFKSLIFEQFIQIFYTIK